jgi:predicted enzyme related to lactoylglutathione lyase
VISEKEALHDFQLDLGGLDFGPGVDAEKTFVKRFTEAGGTVIQAPTCQPYGLMAECTDDQGGRLYLGEF